MTSAGLLNNAILNKANILRLNDNPFNQNRLYGALGYTVNKNMNIQAGYLRHRNGDLNLDRLQLAVFLNTGN